MHTAAQLSELSTKLSGSQSKLTAALAKQGRTDAQNEINMRQLHSELEQQRQASELQRHQLDKLSGEVASVQTMEGDLRHALSRSEYMCRERGATRQ